MMTTMTETINVFHNEIEYEVEFYYQQEEKADRGPEAQYPGCAASIEIEEITGSIRNISVMSDIEDLGLLEEFEQLVWDAMEEERDDY